MDEVRVRTHCSFRHVDDEKERKREREKERKREREK